jgi:hypothetical protein
MKKQILIAAALLTLGAELTVRAQVANEGLANAIIAARQKNATLMKEYSWDCRTEILKDGNPVDTRVESVTWGFDGQPEHTVMSDQGNPPPRGFLRRRIAEREKEQTEDYLKGMRTFLHKYTLPSAGGVINFISQTTIPAPGPDGLLQLTGSSVVVPGDTVSLSVAATTKETRRMKIMSSFQGDDVTVTVTFKTLTGGLTYPAYVQVHVPDKSMSIMIHNYDYMNQNN